MKGKFKTMYWLSSYFQYNHKII